VIVVNTTPEQAAAKLASARIKRERQLALLGERLQAELGDAVELRETTDHGARWLKVDVSAKPSPRVEDVFIARITADHFTCHAPGHQPGELDIVSWVEELRQRLELEAERVAGEAAALTSLFTADVPTNTSVPGPRSRPSGLSVGAARTES
jgi:hypothetical protein